MPRMEEEETFILLLMSALEFWGRGGLTEILARTWNPQTRASQCSSLQGLIAPVLQPFSQWAVSFFCPVRSRRGNTCLQAVRAGAMGLDLFIGPSHPSVSAGKQSHPKLVPKVRSLTPYLTAPGLIDLAMFLVPLSKPQFLHLAEFFAHVSLGFPMCKAEAVHPACSTHNLFS